jgi:uncharacterized RDD family membrane protein YckC
MRRGEARTAPGARPNQRARTPRPLKQPLDLRVVTSPEGLPLTMTLAAVSVRMSAFLADLLIINLSIALIDLLLLLSEISDWDYYSVSRLLSFTLSSLYFVFFELAWQGRTPGKAIYGLRVVDRRGGELTPEAVIARNLTRLVELHLPLILLSVALSRLGGGGYAVVLLAWISAFSFLPLFHQDRLRLGDLIGGTMVIAMPKKMLRPDLSQSFTDSQELSRRPGFAFSAEQLSIYGHQELQVLENILREVEELPAPKDTPLLGLKVAADKIRRRIGRADSVPEGQELRFLVDFYTALRAVLEKSLLFGRYKYNQRFDQPPSATPPSPPGPQAGPTPARPKGRA